MYGERADSKVVHSVMLTNTFVLFSVKLVLDALSVVVLVVVLVELVVFEIELVVFDGGGESRVGAKRVILKV